MTQTFCDLNEVLPFPAQVTVVRGSISTPASTGMVSSRRLQSAYSRNHGRPERRRWRFAYQLDRKPTGSSEYDAVVEAFTQAGGVALPVSWQPPGEVSSIPVLFVANSLRFEHRSAGFVTCQVEFEEFI